MSAAPTIRFRSLSYVLWIMPFVAPKTEKCVRCGKSVYANERIEAGDKVWHRLCFRCSVCDMSLNLNNYNQSDQILYCKKHYQDAILAKNTQTPV